MFRKYIDDNSYDHEFIPPGDCNKNAHIEFFNSIIETEFFKLYILMTLLMLMNKALIL